MADALTNRIFKHYNGSKEAFQTYFEGLDDATKALILDSIIFIHEAEDTTGTGWLLARGEYYKCGGAELKPKGKVVNVLAVEGEGSHDYDYYYMDGELEVPVDKESLTPDSEGKLTGEYLVIDFTEDEGDEVFIRTSSLVDLTNYYTKEETEQKIEEALQVLPDKVVFEEVKAGEGSEDDENLVVIKSYKYVYDEETKKGAYEDEPYNTLTVSKKHLDSAEVEFAYAAADGKLYSEVELVDGVWTGVEGTEIDWTETAGEYLHLHFVECANTELYRALHEYTYIDEDGEVRNIVGKPNELASVVVVGDGLGEEGANKYLDVEEIVDAASGKTTYKVTAKLAEIDPSLVDEDGNFNPNQDADVKEGLVTADVLKQWVAYKLSWEELN